MYDTTSESISQFMSWAAYRIAKEVEDNERIEAEAGTREFIPGSTPPRRSAVKPSLQAKLVKRIDALRAEGQDATSAARDCGVGVSAYYRWKRTLPKDLL